MKFMGANASLGRIRTSQATGNSHDFNTDKRTGMSVRCINNSEHRETIYTWQLYFQGYTHVFLYNKEADGSVTYLNTWPGEMITIYDAVVDENETLKSNLLTNTFTYTSTTKYEGLHVILCRVNNKGEVTHVKAANHDGSFDSTNYTGFPVPTFTGSNTTLYATFVPNPESSTNPQYWK